MVLKEIIELIDADRFGIELIGNENVNIDGLNILGKETTRSNLLSYVTSRKYIKRIQEDCRIKALVVSPEIKDDYERIFLDRDGCLIITKDTERFFYYIHEKLCSETNFYKPANATKKISSSAVIKPTAIIEDNVTIGDNVYVGDYSIIKSGSIIKANTIIGNHAIIGGEGFQVLSFDGIPTKITHCGGVEIGESVTIGDFTTVCKTLFDGYTKIGDNTKIDNYCQIAHYVAIGKNVVITPSVTLVGGVCIEDNVYIGAGATIMNKVIVESGAKVGIGAVVIRNVKAGVTVLGNPAKPIF